MGKLKMPPVKLLWTISITVQKLIAKQLESNIHDTTGGEDRCPRDKTSTNMVKRLYHCERSVDGQWMFGSISLENLKIFLMPLPNRKKERNCFLFNDALNTFYLRLYGVRHMVKDHSDSEKGNLLPPHRLLFPINSKGSFICTILQTG